MDSEMTTHQIVPIETSFAMWTAAKPHLESMFECGVANATDFDNAWKAAVAAAACPVLGVIEEIAAERQRQIIEEGWTAEHDDEHADRSMSLAAACYAGDRRKYNIASPSEWPWDEGWWKPKTPRRDLIRAAALIVAEIERLDRLEPPQ